MENVRRRQAKTTAASSSTPDAITNGREPVNTTHASLSPHNIITAIDGKDKDVLSKTMPKTPLWVYPLLLSFLVVTIVTYPRPFQPHGEPTLKHVFFYGWMTAISTGCGVLPFMIMQDVASFWVGVSNGTLYIVLPTEKIPAVPPLSLPGTECCQYHCVLRLRHTRLSCPGSHVFFFYFFNSSYQPLRRE
jgi:hypothetical protein